MKPSKDDDFECYPPARRAQVLLDELCRNDRLCEISDALTGAMHDDAIAHTFPFYVIEAATALGELCDALAAYRKAKCKA